MYKETTNTITFKLSEKELEDLLVDGLKARGLMTDEMIDEDTGPHLEWKDLSKNIFVKIKFYLVSDIESLE